MKHKICISVEAETLQEISKNIRNKRFRNRSHAFEYAVEQVIKK
tara:strand:+ start:253 stop:384 length:132 start_codon:yes stop_codon:yes gene_type:complete